MNATDRHIQAAGFEVYFNRAVAFLTGHGISLMGTRILAVRGRTSGEWRTNPISPLTLDGARYLVAPRGQTQWVRNIRAAGEGELRFRRKVERVTVTEIPDADKLPMLRAYFKTWGWEVARYFEDLSKNPTDEQLVGVAPGVPVFRIN